MSLLGFVGLWLKTPNTVIINQKFPTGGFFPNDAAIHIQLLLKLQPRLVLQLSDISQELSVERGPALEVFNKA